MRSVFLWPGGNTTALFLDPILPVNRAHIAVDLMKSFPQLEQVGFMAAPVSKDSDCRMDMMGGEFCINATRSAAFYFAKNHNLSTVLIETSGVDLPLKVSIENDQTEIFLSDSLFKQNTKTLDCFVVDLQGIRHLVIESPLDIEHDKMLIETYKQDFSAVGVIHVDSLSHQILKICPYIWVRDTDSFIAETGCGSGSLAAAIVAHDLYPFDAIKVLQPSGETYEISFFLDSDTQKYSFSLRGIVKILMDQDL